MSLMQDNQKSIKLMGIALWIVVAYLVVQGVGLILLVNNL